MKKLLGYGLVAPSVVGFIYNKELQNYGHVIAGLTILAVCGLVLLESVYNKERGK